MASRQFFGTDGIRGVAGQEPMTTTFAHRIGVSAAQTLAKGTKKPHVVIGMDTRRSGPMLAHAISAGLTSRGSSVTWLGIIPTPGISYLTRHLGADAGIVVSASHNPYTDNGIKFFDAKGEKLSDGVERSIEEALETADELPAITGGDIGTASRYRQNDDDYSKFLLKNAPYLDGLRVGLDCANGAAYAIAPRVFKQIGARLDVINASPDGLNINQGSGSTHPETIKARVKELELDVGITFDGDADRALLIDKKGRLVSGDHMLGICAVSRSERAVVATVMSNLGLERYLAANGVELIRTQVGDRYVHEELKKRRLTLGGEQSGHLLFLDKAPTGDGLLSALQTLSAVRKSGRTLEKWMDEIPSYPQTLKNVEVDPKAKQALAKHRGVKKAVKAAEKELGDEGRVNLRPSGTEALVRVMVEGPDKATVERIATAVAAAVEAAK